MKKILLSCLAVLFINNTCLADDFTDVKVKCPKDSYTYEYNNTEITISNFRNRVDQDGKYFYSLAKKTNKSKIDAFNKKLCEVLSISENNEKNSLKLIYGLVMTSNNPKNSYEIKEHSFKMIADGVLMDVDIKGSTYSELFDKIKIINPFAL